MADPALATVQTITGKAYARNADGQMRELAAGDRLREGDIVVTPEGSSVELDMADGSQFAITEPEVAITRDLVAGLAATREESAVEDESVVQVLEALEQGTDLGDVFDPPALGPSGGGDGSSWIRLGRVLEASTPVEFDIAAGSDAAIPATIDEPQNVILPMPGVSVSDASAAEGGVATVVISLSEPSALPVTVSFTTVDGSATAVDGDYIAESGLITFAPGQTSLFIQVQTNADQIAEDDEQFQLVIDDVINAEIEDDSGTVTIIAPDEDDDDVVGPAQPSITSFGDGFGDDSPYLESALADGSSPNPDILMRAGSFEVSAAAGIGFVKIEDKTLIDDNGNITRETLIKDGFEFKITDIQLNDDATYTISYEVRLVENYDHASPGRADQPESESIIIPFRIEVMDDLDRSITTTRSVALLDDNPTAYDDSKSMKESDLQVSGNVMADGTQPDIPGADGAEVTSIAGEGQENIDDDNPLTAAGVYGDVTVAADGSYTYTLTAEGRVAVDALDEGESLLETFRYTLTDGDEDASQANLTITINGEPEIIIVDPLLLLTDINIIFDEADLPLGTSPSPTEVEQKDTFVIKAKAALSSITVEGVELLDDQGNLIAGVTVINDETGVIEVVFTSMVFDADSETYTVSYTATLTGSFSHDSAIDSVAVPFTIVVEDINGLRVTKTNSGELVDDDPIANDDFSLESPQAVAENGSILIDVLADNRNGADRTGADGVKLAADEFSPAGVKQVFGLGLGPDKGTVDYNDDGTFTYTAIAGAEGADQFTYSLTDGDGDTTTATVYLNIGADSTPTVSVTNDELVVDEDDLDAGIGDRAPGDDDPDVTGDIQYDTGLDALKSITLSTAAGGVAGATGLLSLSGVVIVTTWDANEGVLIGHTGDDATVVANQYFKISLDGVNSGGSGAGTVGYQLSLLQPIMHTESGTEDNKSFTVDVSVLDIEDDLGSASFAVQIDDDMPVAEDDFSLQSPQAVAENGAIVIDVLADNRNGVDRTGADGVNLETGVTLVSDPTKGTVTYNGDGTYTYQANVGAEGADQFTYRLTDGDDDTVTATVYLNIDADSTPTVSVTNDELVVDEDDLDAGIGDRAPGDDNPDVRGDIQYDTGLDTLKSIALSTAAGGVAGATGLLSLSGVVIVTTWDANEGVLIGHTGDDATVVANQYFKISLDDVRSGGSGAGTVGYEVSLLQPIQHTQSGTEDNKSFTVDVSVLDVDDDLGSASFAVQIDDDMPVAEDDFSLQSPQAVAENGAIVIDVLADNRNGVDRTGADGVNLETGVTLVSDPTKGTLTYNGDGTYTYQANVGAEGADQFTYRLTDGDDDTVTATVYLNIDADSTPTVSVTNDELVVDEDDLDAGIGDRAAGDDDPDVRGDIQYDTGLDALKSIALSTAAGGVAGATGLLSLSGVDIVTTWDANEGVLIGHTGDDATVVANQYFKISLDDVRSGGSGAGTVGYEVSLLQPIQHTQSGTEDNKSFTVDVSVLDVEDDLGSASFSVQVDDDMPVVEGGVFELSSTSVDTNVLIILDVSGTMADPSGIVEGDSELTRLEASVAAIKSLLAEYNKSGDVSVRIIPFSTDALDPNNAWVGVGAAGATLDSLIAGGYTEYDEAIDGAMAAFNSGGEQADARTVSYFFSDGVPWPEFGEEFDVEGTITDAQELSWTNFLTQEEILAYSIGIGSGISGNDQAVEQLDRVAYDGQNVTQKGADVVEDFSQLQDFLLSTVPSTLEGNLFGTIGEIEGAAGADGVAQFTVTIDGTNYTYDPDNPNAIILSGNEPDPETYEYAPDSNILAVATALGGDWTIDMVSGEYSYTAPDPMIPGTSETLGLELIDGDGDAAIDQIVVNMVAPLPETATVDNLLSGTAGDDVFAWELTDGSPGAPAAHEVQFFGQEGHDALDLRDLLQGEDSNLNGNVIGNLDNYLNISLAGADTVIEMSTAGSFTDGVYDSGAVDQIITLTDVDLVTPGGGDLEGIIQSMLTNGQLITD